MAAAARPARTDQVAAGAGGARAAVAQRELAADDVCPICQCELLGLVGPGRPWVMTCTPHNPEGTLQGNDLTLDCPSHFALSSDDPVLFCVYGCGGNVHSGCMLEWGRHARSQGEQVGHFLTVC